LNKLSKSFKLIKGIVFEVNIQIIGFNSKIAKVTYPILVVNLCMLIIPLENSYSQAVDLIEINSGNKTLDEGLPLFYDCIDKKIDASKDEQEDSYFEKEPTKNEVKTCYKEVFVNPQPTSNNGDE
jgi:hypothetical protein